MFSKSGVVSIRAVKALRRLPASVMAIRGDGRACEANCKPGAKLCLSDSQRLLRPVFLGQEHHGILIFRHRHMAFVTEGHGV